MAAPVHPTVNRQLGEKPIPEAHEPFLLPEVIRPADKTLSLVKPRDLFEKCRHHEPILVTLADLNVQQPQVVLDHRQRLVAHDKYLLHAETLKALKQDKTTASARRRELLAIAEARQPLAEHEKLSSRTTPAHLVEHNGKITVTSLVDLIDCQPAAATHLPRKIEILEAEPLAMTTATISNRSDDQSRLAKSLG